MTNQQRKEQCSEDLWDRISWHSYGCGKKVTVTINGKNYCTIHSPDYKKVKEKKAEEKYKKESCQRTGCSYHFRENYYSYCPFCGTKRKI